MNNHTPGPWKAVEANTDYSGTFNRILSISDAEIAPARAYGDTEEQRHANARLIAAAPDLLAALESAASWVGQYEELPDHAPAARAMGVVIRAAIARARGES